MITLNEFYKEAGGDYDEVVRRLVNEERVLKYLGKFPDDKSYRQLTDALKEKDIESAIYAAHTLKGLCTSLGFGDILPELTSLYGMLRNGNIDCPKELENEISAKYARIIDLIALLR